MQSSVHLWGNPHPDPAKIWLLTALTLAGPACGCAPDLAVPTHPTPQAIQVTVEVVQTPMDATPSACTPLPAGMRVVATVLSATSLRLEVEGLRPGEKPVLVFVTGDFDHTRQVEEIPTVAVGPDGRFAAEVEGLRALPGSTENRWQIKVLHARGVACAEVMLPSMTDAPRNIPTPSARPSATSTQIPTPRPAASPTPTFASEIYPPPVPFTGAGAWGGLSACPNPSGLQRRALSHEQAVEIVNLYATGDDLARRHVTDPALWESVARSFGRMDAPIPPDWVSEPRPARASDYASALGTLCGRELIEASWWVRDCRGPCAEVRSASLPIDFYLLSRGGQWLIWLAQP